MATTSDYADGLPTDSNGLATGYTSGNISNVTAYFDGEEPYFPGGTYLHPHWRPYRDMLRNMHPLVYYALGLYMAVVGIVGTLGNLIVIILFIKTKALRTPPNMFIISLALSDMGFSVTNGFPLFTVAAFQKVWSWGPVACDVYGMAGAVTGLNSIGTLALISIDRYMVIAKPFYAMKHVSHKRSLIQIVLCWIWSTIVSLPPLLGIGYGRYLPEGFQVSCTFDYLSRDMKNIIYVSCLFVFGFFIHIIAIAFSYVGIIRAVTAQQDEMKKTAEKMGAKMTKTEKDKKQDIAMAKIAAGTIGLFLISWSPYAAVALIGVAGNRLWINPFVSQIPVMFAKASAMWNPILYALSHPKFRASLEDNMPWLVVCKGRNVSRDDEKSQTGHKTTAKPARQDSVMSNTSMETEIEMTSTGQGVSTICDKPGTKPMDANNSNSTHLRALNKRAHQEEIAQKRNQAKSQSNAALPTVTEDSSEQAQCKEMTNDTEELPEEDNGVHESVLHPAEESTNSLPDQVPKSPPEEPHAPYRRRLAFRHLVKAYFGFKDGVAEKDVKEEVEMVNECNKENSGAVEPDVQLEASGVKEDLQNDDNASVHSGASGAENSWDVPQDTCETGIQSNKIHTGSSVKETEEKSENEKSSEPNEADSAESFSQSGDASTVDLCEVKFKNGGSDEASRGSTEDEEQAPMSRVYSIEYEPGFV